MDAYYEICDRIAPGTIIKTPSGRSEFKWVHSDILSVIIEVGKKENWLTIPSSCFEKLPGFLRGKCWVRIGATHGIPPENSVDAFLQQFTSGTSVASYVVPIFEKVGMIEILRRRPMRVRWIN